MTNAGLRGHLFAQPIDLTDTDATTYQQTPALDTRGGKSLGLYTEVGPSPTAVNSIQIVCLSRVANRPWIIIPALETFTDSEAPAVFGLFSVGVAWPPLYPGNAAVWYDAYVGLLDETVIVAMPAPGFGDLAASVTTDFTDPDANLTFTCDARGNINGDWGNQFSVQFVDPGLPDQFLGFTSDDGFSMKIHLATDSEGAITTIARDIWNRLKSFGVPFALTCSEPLDEVHYVEATEVLPLAGGTLAAGGAATYSVTGSL